MRTLLIGAGLLVVCSSFQLISNGSEERKEMQLALEEMRSELADLKHSLHAHQTELNLIDEKMRNQSDSLKGSKQKGQADPLLFAPLEKRIAQLEKMQEKISADLRSFHNQASVAAEALQQVKQQIAQQAERLNEVSKLKDALTALNKTMGLRPPSSSEAPAIPSTYTVRRGDSLKAIANRYHLSVEELKRLNNLQSDRILVGQELKLSE